MAQYLFVTVQIINSLCFLQFMHLSCLCVLNKSVMAGHLGGAHFLSDQCWILKAVPTCIHL